MFNTVGCIRAHQADEVIWGYDMPPCCFLGLRQTAAGVKNSNASAGVALGTLSRRTNIVLVQGGSSLDTFRVKQALGLWITAYDISSCLLYKCDIAPHLVLFGPDYAADYAVWLKSGHFASPYLCDMGLMMYLFSCHSPVTSL